MARLSIQFEIPDETLSSPVAVVERQLRESAVAKWYDLGIVSQSRGAELLGCDRVDFLAILSRNGVSPIEVLDGELERDFGE